ncbi:MAG: PCRF domain-containing protein, partial [Chitinophagaceae bacterium]|nr:PCRF domain-containing protein [Chitinophagaceae bacterium]
MSAIIEKLEAIKARFDDLGIALTNPEVVGDNKRFMTVSKEYHKLEKVIEPYRRYRACLDGIAFGKEVLETESDAELRDMAKAELEEQTEQLETLEA